MLGIYKTKEFETFNGPIVFTTNCLVPPRSNSTYMGSCVQQEIQDIQI